VKVETVVGLVLAGAVSFAAGAFLGVRYMASTLEGLDGYETPRERKERQAAIQAWLAEKHSKEEGAE